MKLDIEVDNSRRHVHIIKSHQNILEDKLPDFIVLQLKVDKNFTLKLFVRRTTELTVLQNHLTQFSGSFMQ